jgi:putative ABC transport system ATP-binding protein
LNDVTRTYRMGDHKVRALDGASLTISQGEMVAIMGPSGSGKSSLMNILGCLDRPTSGAYLLNGQDVGGMSDDALAGLRNSYIGFVFQSYNLLPRLRAVENVELPLTYGGGGDRRERAMQALERVGLAHRARHRPAELSGGEQQRVGIARALVKEPRMVLADEPTGNLDSRSSEAILAALQSLNAAGITVLMVTHEADVAAAAKRVVSMRDGRVVSDEPVAQRLVQAVEVAPTATQAGTSGRVPPAVRAAAIDRPGAAGASA